MVTIVMMETKVTNFRTLHALKREFVMSDAKSACGNCVHSCTGCTFPVLRHTEMQAYGVMISLFLWLPLFLFFSSMIVLNKLTAFRKLDSGTGIVTLEATLSSLSSHYQNTCRRNFKFYIMVVTETCVAVDFLGRWWPREVLASCLIAIINQQFQLDI
jgi:hypothetical protein